MQTSPLRSVLYVPASNEKALAKALLLGADAVIVDLEDAVHPEARADARHKMRAAAEAWAQRGCTIAVRINSLESQWGEDDLAAALAIEPDVILLPKVEAPSQVIALREAMEIRDGRLPAIWAMIETPRGILNAPAIAELGRHGAARLAAFVAGANDLMKDTGVRSPGELAPWLMQIVLAARAGGLAALDGVYNDLRDEAGFSDACRTARNRGFDGKTLIHPSQIEPANRIFAPGPDEIAEAQAIADAFSLPENAGKGVVAVNGRMAERLHLAMAEKTLAAARR